MSIFKMAEYFWEFEKSENRDVTIMLYFPKLKKINCDQQKKKHKIKRIQNYFFYFQYMETLETKSSIKVATILYASNICY